MSSSQTPTTTIAAIHDGQKPKRDIEAMDRAIITEASKWAAAWGLGATGLTAWAHYRIPAVRTLRWPYKVITVIFVASGAFFTVADRESMIQDRIYAQQYSITEPVVEPLDNVNKYSPDYILKYVHKNRFSLIAGTWVTAVGAGLLFNLGRRSVPMDQKIISTRMFAQSTALVAVGALGVAASVKSPPPEGIREKRKEDWEVELSQFRRQ
ncbi:hypothetical protein BJ742DRAFT_781020 [Cladochytrium replicatum]|nr:hypothetical protein BJ742DRAFT_781020 [Cladochytrium replicatum]